MPGLEVFLFGRPRVERDGAPVTVARRKTLALLAYLTVTRQAHSRDALVALLWPELDGERGRAALRSTLVDLNTALGKGRVAAEGDQIALRVEPGLRSDVERFHAALAEVAAHSHPSSHACDTCLANLTEAARLYSADFLAGFTLEDAVEFDAWQTFQTESLRLELAAALEKLAQGLAGRQDTAAALAHARRWLTLDPLHEPAQRLIMQLHAGAGDRAAAVRQYRECVKVLQKELGVEPEPETTALFEAIRGGTVTGTSPAGPPAAAPVPAHNLPLAATPFIGREAELAQVADQLADPACRLLTILGPGGIGKTRFAIQAAQTAADHFTHGACFVDLAPIASAELLAATILRTLQVPLYGAAEPDQHILSYLAGKQMLLVLDNYEQLLTGAEPDRRDGYGLVTKILGAAPRIKLLVTSRTRLNVRAEWLAPLEGLETPPEEDKLQARSDNFSRPASSQRTTKVVTTNLDRYSATALFLACVRRVRPDFQPSAGDARYIVHICRLLEGYPLAIELAAAWIRTLPLARIARELERDLGLLTTTMRDMPPRHRSMTAAFDHSWRLLAPREQSFLRQLSVFHGNWTDQAAAAVVGATLAELSGLADTSWLRLALTGRYEMHVLIQQYCARKLETEHESATGESTDQVHGRYAVYYRALLLARQGEFYRWPGSVPEMVAEHDHLLAAWHWYAERDDLEAVRTMIPGLWQVVGTQGWGRAFKSRLEIYARKLKEGETAGSDDPNRCNEMALVRATALTVILGELLALSWESWQTWLEEAMSLFKRGAADDERWREVRWMLRFRVAGGHFERGNCVEAVHLFGALLPELEKGLIRPWPYTDDAQYYWLMHGYRYLGYGLVALGQDREAQDLARQSIALAEQTGVPFLKTGGLQVLALALVWTGDCRHAEAYAREALKLNRAHGMRASSFVALMFMGMALAGQGNYVRARACFHRSVAWGRESGQLLGGSLQHLGAVELALGNLAQAKRFYRETIPLCEGQGLLADLTITLTGLARVALAHGDLAEARGHLLRALKTPTQARPLRHTIAMVATWSEFLQAEGQLEAVAELCAALLSWPATPIYAPTIMRHLRADLESRLQNLAAQLPPAVFAAATGRGRSRQVEEVVAEIVNS